MINIVEDFGGEGVEGGPLAAFTVDLEVEVLLVKFVVLDHVQEGLELHVLHLLGHCSHTNIVEVVVLIVFIADGPLTVGAVVLVVRHVVESSELAAELVKAIYAQVDQSFANVQEVFANEVAAIVKTLVADSEYIAVCVLNPEKSTLKGWKRELKTSSNLSRFSLPMTLVELYFFPGIGIPTVG